MSSALVFITHEGIAENLLTIAEAIIAKPLINLMRVEVPMDAPVEKISKDCEQQLEQLDTCDGIIFVTDIYGATPSNIAEKLASRYGATIISGVNLPMVIRLLNYRDDPEENLLTKALEGARKGIEIHKTKRQEHERK